MKRFGIYLGPTGLRVSLVVGIILLLAAVVLFVGPVSSNGVSCGSPMAPQDAYTFGDVGSIVQSAQCDSALSSRRFEAIAAGILGLAGTLEGAIGLRSDTGGTTHD